MGWKTYLSVLSSISTNKPLGLYASLKVCVLEAWFSSAFVEMLFYWFSIRSGWMDLSTEQQVKDETGFSGSEVWVTSSFYRLHNLQERVHYLRWVGVSCLAYISIWIVSIIHWNAEKSIWGWWFTFTTSKTRSESMRKPYEISQNAKMTDCRAVNIRKLFPTQRKSTCSFLN